jgi:FkbM family methyltransferase
MMRNILNKIKRRLLNSDYRELIKQLSNNNLISNPEKIAKQIADNVKIIKYKYKNHTLYIFNEPATLYHIVNSTEKLEKLALACRQNSSGVCLDIGANVGIFSYFYKYYNPQATIHLFEPDSRLISAIKMNLENFDKCFIHEIAISNNTGNKSFYLNNKSSQTNSTIKDNVTLFASNDDIEKINVETTTLEKFLTVNQITSIDCLKIDVQGAEYEILNHSKTILGNIDQLLLEVCFLMEDTIPTLNLVSSYFIKSKPINSIIMGADLKFYN